MTPRARAIATALLRRLPSGDGGDDRECLPFDNWSCKPVQEAHVLVGQEHVDEPPQRPVVVHPALADAGMRRFVEQRLQPVVRPLGFRTAEFSWSRYAKWLAGAQGVELVERRLIPPLGHFSLVRIRKIEMAVAA